MCCSLKGIQPAYTHTYGKHLRNMTGFWTLEIDRKTAALILNAVMAKAAAKHAENWEAIAPSTNNVRGLKRVTTTADIIRWFIGYCVACFMPIEIVE